MWREQLGSAYEIFDSIGAARFAERARLELRATGGRARPHRLRQPAVAAALASAEQDSSCSVCKGSASIINITPVTADVGMPGASAYGATKLPSAH